METPSKPSSSLSRMALGALDVNQHLGLSQTTPRKNATPTRKSVGYQETPGKALYSLRDSLTPLPSKRAEMSISGQPRSPTRFSTVGMTHQTPSRSGPAAGEKRKEAPTSAARNALDAERAVKQARLSQPLYTPGHSRQSSAAGHGHKLFGEIGDAPGSSQDTVANSVVDEQEEMGDASQLTVCSAPDLHTPVRDGEARVRTPVSGEELRKNADKLRARLQFAMYKLQTRQEDVPIGRVRVVERRSRFPDVVSSPTRLPPTRDASRLASPVGRDLRSGVERIGHVRTPSASVGGVGNGGWEKEDGGGEETEDDGEMGREERERGRDTTSPEQRPGMGMRDGVYGSTPTRGEGDRLLSLVDAIEAAGEGRG